MLWLVPTFHGDIRVERVDAKNSKVIVAEATPEEKRALDSLLQQALKKKWVPSGTTFGPSTLVSAPIEKLAPLLAKVLKPGKKLVSAVKFSNGKIEEMTESVFTQDSKSSQTRSSTPKSQPTKPVVATTVAQPTRGCPAPDFSPARLRAREVLTAFLTDEQRDDFLRTDRFITIGGTTGHRYMLTSRLATDLLRDYHRTLFDLDDRVPLCVHDWDVPPEEELHALNILVQLPAYEHYLRHLEN